MKRHSAARSGTGEFDPKADLARGSQLQRPTPADESLTVVGSAGEFDYQFCAAFQFLRSTGPASIEDRRPNAHGDNTMPDRVGIANYIAECLVVVRLAQKVIHFVSDKKASALSQHPDHLVEDCSRR
jgi:hypothetical protein